MKGGGPKTIRGGKSTLEWKVDYVIMVGMVVKSSKKEVGLPLMVYYSYG